MTLGKEPSPPAHSARTEEVGERMEDLGGRLRALFEAGRKEFETLPLEFEVFARRVVEATRRRLKDSGLPDGDEAVAEVLTRVPGADLFLAIACDEGVPGAQEAFVGSYYHRLIGLARKLGASRDEAEEVALIVLGAAISQPPKGEARSRLGTFNGTGKLFSWLAVQVRRRLAERARARRPLLGQDLKVGSLEEGDGLPEAVDPNPGPSEILNRAEAAARLEEALRSVWKQLQPREVRAVVLRFHQGLSLKDIAPEIGLSVPQTHRVLEEAVRKIRAAVLSRFQDAEPGRWPDLDTLWDMLVDILRRHMKKLLGPLDNPPGGPPSDG